MESGGRKWMGWERKRGKLDEFNRLLRGARDTSFIGADGGSMALLSQVRYVITLDSDTHLPRDVARKLVGAAIHPLNRPRLIRPPIGHIAATGFCNRASAFRSRVLPARGLRASFPATPESIPTPPPSPMFTRISSAKGTYTGKGLYDVDAFEAALDRSRAREFAAQSRSL